MVEEKILEEDALKFAEAIHEFARSKGWDARDYRIFLTINVNYYILRILVVARSYQGQDLEQQFKDYAEITDFINARVGRNSHHFNTTRLVLTGEDDYPFFAHRRRRPGDLEIDETLIHHGAAWGETARQGSS